MTSHSSRSYTLRPSSARSTPRFPSTAIVCTLSVIAVISRLHARARFLVLHCHRRCCFALPRRLRLRAKFPPLRDFFPNLPFPVPLLAFYFSLVTWAEPSYSASPRPCFVPRANLVFSRRLLYSLLLFAAICQFWCIGRWYDRSGLWIQMARYRRRHRLCFLFILIELSHKLMSKSSPRSQRRKNTIRKERTYDVLSIQRESGHEVQKILEKSDISK